MLLSSYANEHYDRGLSGWGRQTLNTTHSSPGQGSKAQVEVLWISGRFRHGGGPSWGHLSPRPCRTSQEGLPIDHRVLPRQPVLRPARRANTRCLHRHRGPIGSESATTTRTTTRPRRGWRSTAGCARAGVRRIAGGKRVERSSIGASGRVLVRRDRAMRGDIVRDYQQGIKG